MKASGEGKGLVTSTVKVGKLGVPSGVGFMGLTYRSRRVHRKRKMRSKVYRRGLPSVFLYNHPLDTTKNRFDDADAPVSQDGRDKECIAS
jgi:hypothetical protein